MPGLRELARDAGDRRARYRGARDAARALEQERRLAVAGHETGVSIEAERRRELGERSLERTVAAGQQDLGAARQQIELVLHVGSISGPRVRTR